MSGKEVKKMLKKNGYKISSNKGKGSHEMASKNGRSFPIPNHKSLKRGTFKSIRDKVKEIEALNE